MENVFHLDATEARVLGVLIEKSLATPDSYPLSLNALTNGVNQKVNREPVMSLTEDEVGAALQGLLDKHLAERELGGRVDKFTHKATRMLSLVNPELAVLAELLLRGPQTTGELRTRASRMVRIESLEDLTKLLEQMMTRGFVKRLDPVPGSRAERYVQLLCPDAHPLDTTGSGVRAAAPASGLAQRVENLEQEVAEMRREIAALTARLNRSNEGGAPEMG